MQNPDNTARPNSNYFIAILRHVDEDSAHAQACGSRVVELEAKTREAAIEEAKSITARHAAPEARLESLQIFEVVRGLEAPLSAWYQKLDAAADKAKAILRPTHKPVALPEQPTFLGKLKKRLGLQ